MKKRPTGGFWWIRQVVNPPKPEKPSEQNDKNSKQRKEQDK
jgi:hypothetical protein